MTKKRGRKGFLSFADPTRSPYTFPACVETAHSSIMSMPIPTRDCPSRLDIARPTIQARCLSDSDGTSRMCKAFFRAPAVKASYVGEGPSSFCCNGGCTAVSGTGCTAAMQQRRDALVQARRQQVGLLSGGTRSCGQVPRQPHERYSVARACFVLTAAFPLKVLGPIPS